MDKWQKSLYEKLEEFIGSGGEAVSPKTDSPMIGINEFEAYVLLKALEAQKGGE